MVITLKSKVGPSLAKVSMTSASQFHRTSADKECLPSGISHCESAKDRIQLGARKPNRDFLAFNKIADGIMRKNSTTAKLTNYEINGNKSISKMRCIVEQYFGLSHLHAGAKGPRFTDRTKNKFDGWYRQAAFNIARGLKILRVATV